MKDFRTSAKQIEEMYNKLEAKQRAQFCLNSIYH